MPSAFSSDITGETGAAPVSPVTDLSSWMLLSSLRQKIQERRPCGRRSCHAVVVRNFCACLFAALQMFSPPAVLPPCAFAFLSPTVALRKRRDLRFFLKRVKFFLRQVFTDGKKCVILSNKREAAEKGRRGRCKGRAAFFSESKSPQNKIAFRHAGMCPCSRGRRKGEDCKGNLAAGALLRLVAQNFLSSLSQPIAGEPPQGESFAVSVQYRIINKEKVGQ